MELKGSRTEKNLLMSFAGESQARNRYTYYASVAKKEGYEQIAGFFLETADNEKEHAKIFFKYLQGGDVEITSSYPAGTIQDTLKNLRAAAAGEKHEWTTLYADFEKIAREEGFEEIAESFKQIASVEKFHEMRYKSLANQIEKKEFYKKSVSVKWHCRNCGYVAESATAPQKCPACRHPQSYYEILAENF